MLVQSANAQNLPGAADPSRVAPEKNLPQLAPSKEAPVVSSGDDAVEGSEAVRFVLQSLKIEGATAFTKEELTPYYAGEIGKEISLKRLYAIAREITRHYRDEGFMLSKALVPQQDFSSGHIRLVVVEGYVAEVTVEGALKDHPKVQALVKKIRSERPVRSATVERYLLLMNDLPGVEAHGVLRAAAPGKYEGGAVSLAIVTEEDRARGSLSASNAGSRYIGPYQLTPQVAFSNYLGQFEELRVQGSVASDIEELQYVDSSLALPIGNDGLKFTLGANYANTEAGFRLEDLGIEGESTTLRAGAEYPVIRSRRENWWLNAEFYAKDVTSDSLGSELYNDSIRALRVGTSYDRADSYAGVSQFTFAATQGFDILGASNTPSTERSRRFGRSDFTKLEASVARLQNIDSNFSLFGLVEGQHAFSQLLAAEEFGFGGLRLGRGYDYSEITGDHGVGATLELRYGGVPEWSGMSFQPFIFADAGSVWRIDASDDEDSATSAGAGVRFYYEQIVSGQLTIAQPLSREPEGPLYGTGKSPRILLTGQVQF